MDVAIALVSLHVPCDKRYSNFLLPDGSPQAKVALQLIASIAIDNLVLAERADDS